MTDKRCCDKCHGHCHRVTYLVDRQLSRATAAQCLTPAKQKETQPPRTGHARDPKPAFSPPLGSKSSFLELFFSLDKASRASLSKGLLQLLTVLEKRDILTISLSPVSQILPQNCFFPKTCPTGATIPKTRHVVGEIANFLLKWTPTQLEKMPSTNPCTTQHQSQPCSKPGAELGHLLCPFQPLIFQNFFTISWPLHSPQAHGLLRNCWGQTVPSYIHLNHFSWGLSLKQWVTGGKL